MSGRVVSAREHCVFIKENKNHPVPAVQKNPTHKCEGINGSSVGLWYFNKIAFPQNRMEQDFSFSLCIIILTFHFPTLTMGIMGRNCAFIKGIPGKAQYMYWTFNYWLNQMHKDHLTRRRQNTENQI